MKLHTIGSGDKKTYYVGKSYRINNKVKTKIIFKIGTHADLEKNHPGKVIEYCKSIVNKYTENEKLGNQSFTITLNESDELPYNKQVVFNAGYLFLQKIYHQLQLDKICSTISSNYQFKYNLNDILKSLVYSRILYPGSKLSSFEDSKNFLEQPSFELHDIYRALDPLCDNLDFIQSQLYKNSNKLLNRDTRVLYYDCTNYFFQIEHPDDFKKYGLSKEHRPLPIVQMGLFMDANGIPIAFNINPGNSSEQVTVQPTEEMIIKDFGLSKFVYCSDAGLGSYNNRWFNSIQNRAFIVTQSLKKLPKDILKTVLDNNIEWSSLDNVSFKSLDVVPFSKNLTTVYKKIPLNNKQIKILIDNQKYPAELKNQSLILSFSPKFKEYQSKVRSEQFERAKKYVDSHSSFHKSNVNDCKRFIKNMSFDKNGELIDSAAIQLDYDLFNEESKLDGYYCIATNLDDDIKTIISISSRRWEIEESFRIMKTDLHARPVFVSLEKHIKAHFLTCFIALLIYRILENKLNSSSNSFTSNQIFEALRNFNLKNNDDLFYEPLFIRTKLTDSLESSSNISLHFKAISKNKIEKILKFSKTN